MSDEHLVGYGDTSDVAGYNTTSANDRMVDSTPKAPYSIAPKMEGSYIAMMYEPYKKLFGDIRPMEYDYIAKTPMQNVNPRALSSDTDVSSFEEKNKEYLPIITKIKQYMHQQMQKGFVVDEKKLQELIDKRSVS